MSFPVKRVGRGMPARAPSLFTTITVEGLSRQNGTARRWGKGQHTDVSAMAALPSMPPQFQRTGEVLCGSATAAMKNVWRQTVAYVEIAISKPTSFPPRPPLRWRNRRLHQTCCQDSGGRSPDGRPCQVIRRCSSVAPLSGLQAKFPRCWRQADRHTGSSARGGFLLDRPTHTQCETSSGRKWAGNRDSNRGATFHTALRGWNSAPCGQLRASWTQADEQCL